jgi:hypothetical protein
MGTVVLNGATSGSTTLTPTDAVTATLTLPSATGTLLSTANPQSGGVIQVVQSVYSTAVSSSSTTLADTGLSASITPKFSTSKILVLVTHGQNWKSSGNSGNGITFKLLRGASIISNPTNYAGGTDSAVGNYFSTAFNYLDSPATTSLTTYKTQFANATAASTVVVQSGNLDSTITLLEIAA